MAGCTCACAADAELASQGDMQLLQQLLRLGSPAAVRRQCTIYLADLCRMHCVLAISALLGSPHHKLG